MTDVYRIKVQLKGTIAPTIFYVESWSIGEFWVELVQEHLVTFIPCSEVDSIEVPHIRRSVGVENDV